MPRLQAPRAGKPSPRLKQIDEWRVVDRRPVGMFEGKMLVWLLVFQDDGTTVWNPYFLAEDGVTVLEEPVFCPLPGSQFLFLSSPIFETAYMGNRGGGKCVDEGDVLTPDRGWVDIRVLRVGDFVYTFDEDGEMLASVVESVFSEKYTGPMVRRMDRGLYMSFTPNHSLPIVWPDGRSVLRPYCELRGQADVLRSISRWDGGVSGSVSVEECLERLAEGARLGRETLNAPSDFLRGVLHGIVDEYGFWRKLSTEAIVRTENAALADVICELGVKLCFNVSMMTYGVGTAGKRRVHQVVLTPGKATRLYTGKGSAGSKNVEEVQFDGMVYCIGVPFTHSFVLRQRGCVWLSGNSDSLLLSYASGVGRGYGRGYRGILFRKEFGDLDDIVRKVETIFPRIYGDHFRFLKSKSEYTAVWDTGEALLLRNLPNEDAYREYHGHSYAWIGFEELTQWPDDKPYRLMFSCARSPGQGVPVVGIRSTSNPYGVGHNWVKKRFRLPQGFGKVIRRPGEAPRVAIQSDLRENFVLLHTNPDYPNLIRQAASNPAQEKAWLYGDWNVTTGGMFDDLWLPNVHAIPNITPHAIPYGWRLNRTYDHGQARPFAVLWWAESNGEPIHLLDGRIVGQVPGDLILWAEWYGTKGTPDEGVWLSARQIAQGIRDRERDWRIGHRVRGGPADSSIYTKDTRGTMRSPADDMEDAGVIWQKADKSPGSRIRGYQMIRGRLTASKPNMDGSRDYPGMFVCERCVHWLELVPSAPRDTENQDELPDKYEDHLIDATRYRLSSEDQRPWQRDF